MTVGDKITDNTADFACYDIAYPSMLRFERGTAKIGGYHRKTWNGGDSIPVPRVYESTWFWVPGERRPRLRYRRVRLPKRANYSDHLYDMTLNVWQDRAYEITTKSPYPPYATEQVGYRTYRKTYGGLPSPLASTVWDGNDDIALIGKLRESIAGSDFNAGVFLGEGRQSLKLIADAATRIYKAYKSVRRFDMAGLSRALGLEKTVSSKSSKGLKNDASNKWLEVQYGWLPLLQDAKGGAEMLAKQLNAPLVQNYKVRKQKALALGPGSLSPNIVNGKAYTYTGTTRGQYIARVKEVNVPHLIGLTDPASVGWELVPFSFVADWFIPIGGYLAARGLSQSLTGSFVKTMTREERFSCFGEKISANQSSTGMSYIEHSLSVHRSVSSSLIVPLPNFKPLEKVASWKHCANAVALLIQTFGSGGRAYR
jgi:hypothetical protein